MLPSKKKQKQKQKKPYSFEEIPVEDVIVGVSLTVEQRAEYLS